MYPSTLLPCMMQGLLPERHHLRPCALAGGLHQGDASGEGGGGVSPHRGRRRRTGGDGGAAGVHRDSGQVRDEVILALLPCTMNCLMYRRLKNCSRRLTLLKKGGVPQ